MRSLARKALAAGALGALGALLASPAAANFHLMRIVQVYGGDVSHPDAQYVVLQMCTGGQNFVNNHPIEFFDASGASLGMVRFGDNVGSGADQAKVLIATSSAETVFGITSDLRQDPPAAPLPAALLTIAGGKVCFDSPFPIDCFAWGSYSPSDPDVGNPFNPAGGLEFGVAAQRDLAIVPPDDTLQCVSTFDDTDDSADDFDPTTPTPVNNAGAAGTPNPDHVFVHGFEGNSVFGWSFTAP
jgi:hypothetical protein